MKPSTSVVNGGLGIKNMEKSYLFYDIETTGLNKSFDQVIQFAAIRTDLQLNELDRYEFFIRLNPDIIPSPEAFVTHRISLSQLNNGLDEFTAIQKIHTLLNTPGTISLGYNTLGFDDEFLRFSFYRNLLPPYSHQYANNCSRMDLYPITVMYYLFKNVLLKWPTNNLKLENLTKMNDLARGLAHNALVDVSATLSLARCLQQDSKTWNYLTGYFDKQIDLARCEDITRRPDGMGILIDGKFGHLQHYQAAVAPLGIHNFYKNQYMWLRLDHEELAQANTENFTEHAWVINKKIGETAWILPLKKRFVYPYLQQKQAIVEKNINWLRQNSPVLQKIKHYYQNYTYPAINNLDVDASLYEKGFPSFQEQEIFRQIQAANPEHKLNFLSALSSEHYKEMLVRIMGRHFSHLLRNAEKEQFENYVKKIWSSSDESFSVDYRGKGRLTIKDALNEISELDKQPLDEHQRQVLFEVERYIQKKLI